MEVQLGEFREAGAKLLDLGDRKLVLGMRRDLREIAKPVGDRLVGAIADAMPKRGGLAARIRAEGRVSLLVDLRRGVRIQLANNKGMRMGGFEDGEIRKPTFGNRKVWRTQSVPANKGAEQFEKEADALATQVADKVTETIRRAL